MRAVLVILGSLLATGCEGECFDSDPDNNYGTSCEGPDPVDSRGESYRVDAFAGAGDHFTAYVRYIDDRQPAQYIYRQLVDLDADGQVLAVTDSDLELPPSAAYSAAADGNGSFVLVESGKAHFLQNGAVVTETTFVGHPWTAYAAGSYWFAFEPSQIQRFDTAGTLLAPVYLGDAMSSQITIASDPLGDDLAAGWLVPGMATDSVIVHRIRNNVAEAIEVASLTRPNLADHAWSSAVAMRAGTIAVFYGFTTRSKLALISPDNQISTKLINLPDGCAGASNFIGTPYGYLMTCGNRFVLLDAEGDVRTVEQAPTYAYVAHARDAALAISGTQEMSIETRVVSSSIEEPVIVFEGHATEIGTTFLGCSASQSPSWLVALALLLVRRRRAK